MSRKAVSYCCVVVAGGLLMSGCAATPRLELRPIVHGWTRAAGDGPWVWEESVLGLSVEAYPVVPATRSSFRGRIVNGTDQEAHVVIDDGSGRTGHALGARWAPEWRVTQAPIVAGSAFNVPAGDGSGPAVEFELQAEGSSLEVHSRTTDDANFVISLNTSRGAAQCDFRFRVVESEGPARSGSSDLEWWHPVAAVVLFPVYIVARLFGDPLH